MRASREPTLILLAVALIAVVGFVAIPALAAGPSPSGSPATSASPEASHEPGKGSKSDKAKGPKFDKAKRPSLEATLSGTLATRTAADGQTEYILTVGSTTYTMDAGPAWYWKDAHPLMAYVGRAVTIVGEHKQGSTEVDVHSVDGQALREPGMPPWAGGWKRVGQDHPGWSQEKADRWATKVAQKQARFGLDCWPPGHCKDGSGKPVTPAATPTPTLTP